MLTPSFSSFRFVHQPSKSPLWIWVILILPSLAFGGDVTSSVQRLGNPTLAKFPANDAYPRNAWDLKLWGNRIYIGSGDSALNRGPIDIWSYDLSTHQFVKDIALSQEQIDLFPVCGTTLCIPAHDPGGGGVGGDWYRLEATGWKGTKTMTTSGINVVHSYDIMQHGSLLVAGLATNQGADLAVSTDNGQTWTHPNQGPPDFGGTNWGGRIYALFEQAGQLFASAIIPTDVLQPVQKCGIHVYQGGLLPQRTDLTFGKLFPGIDQNTLNAMGKQYGSLRREVNFKGQVVYIGGTEFNDHQLMPFGVYYGPLEQVNPLIKSVPLPAGALPWDLLVSNNVLYMLVGAHSGSSNWIGGSWRSAVYSTTDLQNWTELFYFDTGTSSFARSFEVDANGNFYFGLGTGMPANGLLFTKWQDRPDSRTFSNDSGDFLTVPKSAYSGAPVTPPVVTSGSTSGQVSVPFSYLMAATNNPTSYTASPLPPGLSINTATGQISGTPTATTSGALTVNLSATNSAGTGTGTLALTVGPAPAITSALTATGVVARAFSYQITANNSPVTYGATGLPVGLTINTTTGRISGTPTTAGVTNVTIRAIGNSTATDTLVITVSQGGPVITNSPATSSGQTGVAFSFQIQATNSPTSYNATPLPAGLSINTVTGHISGTPTATTSGAMTVNLSATNASGTGTGTLALTITALPTITSPLTASGSVGQAFTYQITANNNPTSFSATGLPAALTLNTTTGQITGTPTASGATNVTIRAIGSSTASATLVLTIQPAAGAPPVITSPGNASGQVGRSFSYTIQATNNPTSFNAVGLPPGLSVDLQTGEISGIPEAGTAGTYTLTVSATNSRGTGTRPLVLVLTSAPLPPPILSLPPELPINAVIQVTYPSGYSIAQYQWTFTPLASGGNNGSTRAPTQAPVSFLTSVSRANLASLTLAAGAYSVDVVAIDAWQNVSGAAQGSFSLVTSQLGAAKVYPNPWRFGRHSGVPITFSDLPPNARLQIFTVSGHRIRDAGQLSAVGTWDLRNDNGETVGSGVYLYLLTTPDGQTQRGKFAIVR